MENILIGGSNNSLNNRIHPYILFKEKISFLEKIQKDITLKPVNKSIVPFFQIDDMMGHYNKLQKKIDYEKKQEKKFKKPNEYETIFEENHDIDNKEIEKVIFIKFYK